MNNSITVQLSDDLFNAVCVLSKNTGMTKAYIVRNCVMRELENFASDLSPLQSRELIPAPTGNTKKSK